MADILTHSGTKPNWKWNLAQTPDEWWRNYQKEHPDYNPYKLDETSWSRIYGSVRSNHTKIIDKDDSWKQFAFLDSHFGVDYQEILVPSRIGEYQIHLSSDFDPSDEKQDTYLHFARLSRLIENNWDANTIKKEVLKFVIKFGPPWYGQFEKYLSPPFDEPLNGPLTVDGILWESLKMSWALDTYRLLNEINEDFTAIPNIKRLMLRVMRTGGFETYIFSYNLYAERRRNHLSLINPGDILKIGEQSIHLDNDKQTVDSANHFVQWAINTGLAESKVLFGIFGGQEKDSFGISWTPLYETNNLMGKMWFQFYRMALQSAKLRVCANKYCNRLFNVTRSDKKYCSKSCGVTQYLREHPDNDGEVK